MGPVHCPRIYLLCLKTCTSFEEDSHGQRSAPLGTEVQQDCCIINFGVY